MSYKTWTYISLLFFIGIALFFYISALNLPPSPVLATIGPGYFPEIISLLIIIFSLISFVMTIKKKEDTQHFHIPNLGYIVFTIALIAIFVGVWSIFHLFYIPSFIFLSILIYRYNQEKLSLIKILKSSGTSLVIVLIIYLVFERLLSITF